MEGAAVRQGQVYVGMEKLFFEFLQVAVGNRKSLSVGITDEDWLRLFEFCKKQALIGVGFTALEHLHTMGVECPLDIGVKWMAMALNIERQNDKRNQQCAELTRRYKHDGLSTCILKGQGNLLNYPEHLRKRRQCGDIDVWTVCKHDIPIAAQTGKDKAEYVEYHGRKAVIEYVKQLYRLEGKELASALSYHHLDAPNMDGTPVEVHFRPAHLYSPWRNWRLQRWFKCHEEECMMNMTQMGFAVPTTSVNVVFQMAHMYKHYIDGGLGLRHLMDYYYALRVWHNDVMECKDLQSQGMWCEGLGTHVMSNEEVMSVIRSFGMTKFAAAVMYVLHKVFDMSSHYYICEPNEKEGKKLLADIMNIGNFGHYNSKKPNMYQHRLKYHIWKFKRMFLFAISYPEEALCEPVFRVWRKVWRKIVDY